MGNKQAVFPEHTFETALERLEQIVAEMEGDRLALEDLLTRYEEGTRLVKVCQQRLDAAEKRIELISREASGESALVGFDPSLATTQPATVTRGATQKKSASDEVSLF